MILGKEGRLKVRKVRVIKGKMDKPDSTEIKMQQSNASHREGRGRLRSVKA